MYPTKRFHRSDESIAMTLPFATVLLRQIFLTFFSFFTLQAFSQAVEAHHPYENNRFLNAYATLQQPSAQIFENISLRDALKNIQSASGVSIWLDRRIDGEHVIQLKPGKRTHLECIAELCKQTDTETAWLENILYIAPSHQSSRIENAYWGLFTHRANDALQKKGRPLSWNQASEIQSVLDRISQSTSVKVIGLEALEHDIWGPATIPEASIAAQWSCLLAGFDRSMNLDAQKRWRIIELPPDRDVEFAYAKQLAKVNAKRLDEWRAKWPTAKIAKLRNGFTSITAPVAAHRELIAATIKLKEAPPPTNATWSLEYKGEFGRLLEALSKQLDLQVSPSPLPDELASKQIEIKVKDGSIDILLDAVSKQLGIPIQREGNKVILNMP
jgi:hypothetical protein